KRSWGQKRQLGGRGFNSSRERPPATAPGLMRRIFFVAKTFDFFSRNQSFQTARQQIPSTEQGRGIGPTAGLVHYFSVAQGEALIRKFVAKFPGGGVSDDR